MRHALVLAPALALALVAMPPTAAAIEREITLYLHEDPLHALPETINANVGDVLKLTVENPEAEGKTVHNLRVCGDPYQPNDISPDCARSLGQTPNLQPGESAPLTVTLDEAGTFEYYCYIPGHKGGGMAGLLHVAGDEAANKGIPFGPLALLALALALLALALRRRSA